jgi:hypothetical protein
MITPASESRDFRKPGNTLLKPFVSQTKFGTMAPSHEKWRYPPSFAEEEKRNISPFGLFAFLFFVSGIPEGGFLRQASGTVASSLLAAAGSVSFFQLRTWRDTRYGRQWARTCRQPPSGSNHY